MHQALSFPHPSLLSPDGISICALPFHYEHWKRSFTSCPQLILSGELIPSYSVFSVILLHQFLPLSYNSNLSLRSARKHVQLSFSKWNVWGFLVLPLDIDLLLYFLVHQNFLEELSETRSLYLLISHSVLNPLQSSFSLNLLLLTPALTAAAPFGVFPWRPSL